MEKQYITASEKRKIQRWVAKLEHDPIRKCPLMDAVAELNLPYEVLGAGAHRIVFDIGGGYILKVARVTKGIRCNANEVNLYQKAPEHLRKHLCKIAAYGHGWLVMKKMKKKVPKKEEYEVQLHNIYREFCGLGIRVSDVLDKKSGKVKRKNTRLSKKHGVVLIDYANTYPWTGPPPEDVTFIPK